jgi:hypothetical protein
VLAAKVFTLNDKLKKHDPAQFFRANLACTSQPLLAWVPFGQSARLEFASQDAAAPGSLGIAG